MGIQLLCDPNGGLQLGASEFPSGQREAAADQEPAATEEVLPSRNPSGTYHQVGQQESSPDAEGVSAGEPRHANMKLEHQDQHRYE